MWTLKNCSHVEGNIRCAYALLLPRFMTFILVYYLLPVASTVKKSFNFVLLCYTDKKYVLHIFYYSTDRLNYNFLLRKLLNTQYFHVSRFSSRFRDFGYVYPNFTGTYLYDLGTLECYPQEQAITNIIPACLRPTAVSILRRVDFQCPRGPRAY